MKLTLRNYDYKRVLFIALLIFGFGFTNAQTLTIKGTVSADGDTLPGASVIIKGSSVGQSTEMDGTYQIKAKVGDVLVFSFLGYKSKEVTVRTGSSTINVELLPEASVLDEIVVVGYGTQRKKEVTGAVAKVTSETIEKLPVADLGAALQGQVAGVNIQASSGRPGASANVQIRGLGSVNPGSSGPLYIVDGIPAQGNPNIAPEQIESIDVLKDGGSIAVYGVRGSNGIILITTKRGKAGSVKINLNAYTGVQNITSFTPLMNTRQQLYAEEIRYRAIGQSPLTFQFNPNALNYDSDFVGDVTRNNSLVRNVNLNINGGSENLKVNFNTTLFDQDGVLLSSGFQRLTNRLTVDFTKNKFKAFASVGFTTEDTKQEPWALYELSISQRPWQPGINDITSSGENTFDIPVRNAILYSYLSRELENIDERKVRSNNISLNLQYEILEGLDFKLNLGRNNYNYERKFFRPQYLVRDFSGSINPTASRAQALLNEDYISSQRETIEGIFNYKKSFDKHNLALTGVISYEKFNNKTFGVGVIFDENASNDIQTLGSGAEGIAPTSNFDNSTLAGKMFRVQYNYDGKYLLSGTYRRDGSSKFAPSNKYGDFFGFSAGWNIHDEKWFQDSDALSFINSLKLRGSWAELGNQNIPSYAFQPIIEAGINYPFGPNEAVSFGQTQRRFVDKDIRWEKSASSNIGLDASFLDKRLTFSADFYQRNISDMLLQERLPPSTGTYHPNGGGYDVKVINAGDMTNKGMEFAISYKDQTESGLKYNISSTFTKNINEVTNLNGVTRGYANGRPVLRTAGVDFTTFLAVGHEAGAFFLLQNNGVIKDQATLTEYQKIDGSAQLGDMMYIDQNGDNKLDDNDRVYAGSGQPEFEGGVNINLEYKGFDLFVQNYFAYGAEIYNGSKLLAYMNGRHTDLYNMWSPQNPTSNIPTDRINALHNNVRARSDYFLEDGSYWRIRNITLGYTLPTIDKIGLDRARVYISSVNPFTFTKYSGYDPEVGGDGLFTRGVDRGDYPVTRQFMLGVQLSF